MKFDKETVIVILIAAALMAGWFLFYPKYHKQKMEEQAVAAREAAAARIAAQQAKEQFAAPSQTVQTAAETSAKETAAAPAKLIGVKGEKTYRIGTEFVSFEFDAASGSLLSADLLKFKNAKDHSRTVVGLNEGAFRTFQLEIPASEITGASGEKKADGSLEFVRDYSNGLRVTQTVSVAGDYQLLIRYVFRNTLSAPLEVKEFVLWSAGLPQTMYFSGDKIYSERYNIDYSRRAADGSDSKPESFDPTAKDKKFESFAVNGPVNWAGTTNKYFASLLFTSKADNRGLKTARVKYPDPENSRETYVVPAVGVISGLNLEPGASSAAQEFSLYFGPKEIARITKLPESVMDGMHISYFSWFEFLARPMVRFLVWLNGKTHSYGWAIILLTIIVRLIFWPVTQKANNSMRKMQKLKPRMDEIRKKYKDNPQEMNMRMMELYRTEKVSPLGGCLPILLQIPVFFALYSALDSAVELRQVSFLWCTDLAKPDLVGPQIDLPFFGPTGLHPLVIAMTVLMVVQQKMTPSNMDPMQQKMMMLMPVVMLFMLYNLPSGLTLYWTVSQIFSILQMKYGQIIAKREEARDAANPPRPKNA